MLNKPSIKLNVLKYLLLERKGQVFSDLVANLNHHSLSILLIELMQLTIVPLPEDNFKMDWDNEGKEEPEVKPSEEQ